ncbi:uncharacterized protein FOMMEDRAFT_168016 [Fomitiporia mediterranea MF3/22]|uniref:uncharacterized protein n=1 Tax=Fomitiporia mediterranea (strain MF3/22) TaxID=694068 RepID=UPI0004409017|nr:uncharacterized protein FOMMEDRAFT_168016 [Fomitiporia mediterranea MF3/22]EJD02897.1 hypothetical protein FOMMEDRAFT_168016 [Fomitiporia mediterranea MF3/22]
MRRSANAAFLPTRVPRRVPMISYTYVDEVNSNLICCVCHCPFLNPVVTTTCSHTFCRRCIERSLEQQPCCPVDRSPLTLDDLKPENLLLRNMVDELIVECPLRSSGCRMTCQRQLLDSHLRDACQFVQVPCSEDGCEQTVLRRDLGKHTHDCVHRLVNCIACGTSVTASELEAHNDKCVEQETQCVACSEKLKRGGLIKHTATCPEVLVACMHSAHGCPWNGRRRCLPEHLQSCSYEAIKGFFAVNDTLLSALRDENTVLRQNLNNAETSIHVLRRELAIARRALGPWWQPGDSPRAQASEVTDPSSSSSRSNHGNHSDPQQQQLQQAHRWRSPNPLSPIVNFSPESSPASPPSEVDSISSNTSPGPSFSDPAFLASYFPSSTISPSQDVSNSNSNSNNNNNAHAVIPPPPPPPIMQVDPLTRHLFPFSSRLQPSPPFPPPPIRFPDLSGSITPSQPSSNANTAGGATRVAPINLNTTLENALLSLRTSIASVSSSLDALARRTDVALTTENLRMNEEVGALRAIVHGLRMQVHALITERNGATWGTTTTTTYYNHSPPPANPPLVINSTTQTTKL